MPVSLYCWTSSSSVRLVAFSLYCWPTPYTVGLLPILLAFSLYSWPSPYTVGLLPILLAFSLYCWPSPYIRLAFSLYCWPSPYTVGLLPILLAFSLYCWLFPYTVYTVGLLPILLAFSLCEPLSIVYLCSISVPLFTMCIADLWDTHTTHLVHGHFLQVTHAQCTVWTLNVVALLVVMHIFTSVSIMCTLHTLM